MTPTLNTRRKADLMRIKLGRHIAQDSKNELIHLGLIEPSDNGLRPTIEGEKILKGE